MKSRPVHRRPGASVLAALTVAALALMASCVTPTPVAPPPNPSGLRTTMVADGIQVDWNPSVAGQMHGYELRWREDGAEEWNIVSTVDTSLAHTAVTPGERYWFRVRAATAPGGTPAEWSPAVGAWYVQPVLPVVRVETQGRAPILDKENYVPATFTIDPNGTDVAPYTGTIGIRGRGNSTWTLPKKPYKVKLDTKSALMGMPSKRDWALLANAFDRSQVRTTTAAAISEATDLAWTPRYRHVEVLLNGEYQGVYQLSETVEPGSNRVDIDELEDTDNALPEVSGGYLLELDDRLEENNEPGWRTARNVPIVVKEPDPTTPAQRSYIRNHITTFENRLFSTDYTDPVLGFRPYLDIGAFIDLYLVQEITRNGDSYWSSTYFYKKRDDDKLYFGPMWDFDRSMGSSVTPREQPPEGWYARNNGPWVKRLFTDPQVAAAVDARVQQLMPFLTALPAQIGALATSLQPAIANDAVRWNYEQRESDTPAYLQDWLTQRVAWMAANSPPPPA